MRSRFEIDSEAEVSMDALETDGPRSSGPERTRTKAEMTPAEAEEDTYTSRLLKAKKKVWDENDRPDK